MRKLETLDRALLLLQEFGADSEEITVVDLAERLELHHSSVSRMVGTLLERGFLKRNASSGALRIGPELGRLGLLALAPRDVFAESREVMEHLARWIDETVVLSILDKDETVEIAQVDSAHLIGAQQWIGRRAPIHTGSVGKVFMAFGGPDPRTLDLTPVTERTITSLEKLQSEITKVRRRGWSESVGEYEKGLNGVAAPVLNAHGKCVYVLNASGPEYRLTPERLPDVGEQTAAAGRRLSARLGFAARAMEPLLDT